MATYKLKRKLFFEYGITTADIGNYAKQNKLSAKDAYSALKTQRQNQGINEQAFKKNDRSAISGNTKVNTTTGQLGKSAGSFQVSNPQVPIRQSAQAAGQASAGFNKGYNLGKTTGINQGKSQVGLLQGAKNTWNNMGKFGKGAVIGTGLLAGGLMINKVMEKKRNRDDNF